MRAVREPNLRLILNEIDDELYRSLNYNRELFTTYKARYCAHTRRVRYIVNHAS